MDEQDQSRASLDDLVADSRIAASSIEEAFARAGAAIESSLAAAARTGGDVFDAMSQRIVRSLADLAVERLVSGPLTTILDGALRGLPFVGQRADGGPVLPGGAYLVGERGPEIFTPSSAGSIESAAAGAVSVHFHLTSGGDADALRRSQGQIATLVARAVAQGSKRL